MYIISHGGSIPRSVQKDFTHPSELGSVQLPRSPKPNEANSELPVWLKYMRCRETVNVNTAWRRW